MHMEKGNSKAQGKITIEDIANELGCSKTTVSRAISGKGRIGKEMQEKVLSYSKEHGYKPSKIAKGLAKNKSYNIGVVLPSDQDLNEIPFFQNCLLGICEMAAGRDYDTLVTTADMDDISHLENIVENNKVDGIILTRTLIDDKQAAYLKTTNIPFIVIGSVADKEVLQIDNNHVEACRELTSLLLSQNIERIAFVAGNEKHVVNRRRYQGYVEGYGLQQIEPPKDMFFPGCNNKVLVDKAVEEILQKRTDCILTMDDKICSQVLRKLSEEHVQVPRDIMVASFYDSYFLQSNNPPITSLRFDERALGGMACKLLLDKMKGQEVPLKTLLGYDIVLKASTKRKL